MRLVSKPSKALYQVETHIPGTSHIRGKSDGYMRNLHKGLFAAYGGSE
jgi:hypothetical protein